MNVPAVLHPEECSDPAVAGAKAVGLARLMAAGFRVPPFVVLPVGSIPRKGRWTERWTAALKKQIQDAGLEPNYAVRSSAAAEDGGAHSHAGQFETFLRVTGSGLGEAAQAVAGSGAGAGIAAYRKRTGAPPSSPAVIIQEMLYPRCAGVFFTADPVSGLRRRLVVSAISGTAERLVGGEEDGEDYTLDLDSGLEILAPAGDRLLSGDDMAALADAGRRVEELLGGPADVEWAFVGDDLHVLQARPVTTALRRAPVVDPARTVLDCSNIVESYPGLVSPLTHSFAVHVYARVYARFLRLSGVPEADVAASSAILENMLARYRGRMYYNLANWYRALAMLPGFSGNAASMETMMGLAEPVERDWVEAVLADLPRRGRAERALAAIRGAASIAWQAVVLGSTKRSFLARLDQILEGSHARIAGASLTALAREYRTVERDLLDRWDAPLVNDFLCMASFGLSRRLAERWAGPEGLEIHNAVMIGQGDIVSAEPARRIAEMADLVRAEPALADALAAGKAPPPPLAEPYSAYLEKFGDRCVAELKLESLPLTSDDATLRQAILATAAAPRREHARAAKDPLARLDALVKRPDRRHLLRALMDYAKARVRDRENLRFERTRIFGHARRVFVAIGEELHARGEIDDPRDVFMLTHGEILGYVEGASVGVPLREIVRPRREAEERAAATPAPPQRLELVGPVGAASATAALPKARPTGTARGGTGASAGIVEGIAAVVTDPRGRAIAPGQILVAQSTDPGWIALFANAAAIVVEKGSLLSHSAIVARELGIPCVVGLSGATDWIADGEEIRVDGASGLVEKLSSIEEAAE